jgi:predicted acetyltransferase
LPIRWPFPAFSLYERTVTDDITIEVPSADDWDDIFNAAQTGFNQEPDDKIRDFKRRLFEPERALVARRDGEIVGTAGIFTRQLCVPGAVVPTAHVTLIAVVPTARRQGILDRFMGQQFGDARRAGEPIAALWASEGRIYQRYGYGLAARRLDLSIDTREVRLSDRFPSTGRLREAEPADVVEALAKVYDEAFARNPGWSERTSRHWEFIDPESWRNGASRKRAVLHEGDHGVDGYAVWRVKSAWDDSGPVGEVYVLEHVTTTPEAYASIWRFLLTLDLTRSTSAWACSVDEPLLFMVNEPRRIAARQADALWVRVLDVPAALAARRYAADVDVVIDVTDDRIPENTGRWRLSGSLDGARCESTVDPADLSCDIQSLGAAYLGGTPLASLAAGGGVREHSPGALASAAAAFHWYQTPSSIEVF